MQKNLKIDLIAQIDDRFITFIKAFNKLFSSLLKAWVLIMAISYTLEKQCESVIIKC